MNAKEEFINLSKGLTVIAAVILYEPDYNTEITIRLKASHTQEDLEYFLNQLDFEYDPGYGRQYLKGTVWFREDGGATRGEYDGSEWWCMHSRPELPEKLL